MVSCFFAPLSSGASLSTKCQSVFADFEFSSHVSDNNFEGRDINPEDRDAQTEDQEGVLQGSSIPLRKPLAKLTTEEIQKIWISKRFLLDWSAKKESNFWAQLINLERAKEAKEKGLHESEVFGVELSSAWYSADLELKKIPLGELHYTPEFFSEIHKILMENQKAKQSFFGKLLPFFKGRVFTEGGVYRKRRVFHSYLEKPISLEKFEQIKRNKEIIGIDFIPEPFGRGENEVYGVLLYPSPKNLMQKVNELCDWFNTEKAKIDEQSQEAMDPIALAATFQFKFVGLHPFLDGNGRISRLLMTRILREFDLPPSIRESFSSDIDLPLDTHIQNVREGIINFIRHIKRITRTQEPPNISNRGYGTKIKDLMENDFVVSTIMPENINQIFDFSKIQNGFLLSIDGFFYNSLGIPHAVNNGKLYPIADATYRFYAFGGHYDSNLSGVKRKPNPEHKKLYLQNLQLAHDVNHGLISERDVDVAPYLTIKKANKTGSLFFYDWQTDLLKHVTIIREDPKKNPFAVLVQNRGDPINNKKSGTTHFENMVLNNYMRISVSDIIGQYELRDLDFYKLKNYVQKNIEGKLKHELLDNIYESRKKLHGAGRVLLKRFFELKKNLSELDLKYLNKHPEFIGYTTYLEYSKLGFDDFNDAIDKLDDQSIYLLRGTSEDRVNILGFRSEKDILDLIEALPSNAEIKDLISEVNSVLDGQNKTDAQNYSALKHPFLTKTIVELARENPAIRHALIFAEKRILENPFKHRGMEEEYDRFFVDLLLHASNFSPKKGISTTVSPKLLFNLPDSKSNNRIRFTDDFSDGAVFLFRVSKDDVEIQYGSKWRDQYEVYVKNTIGTLESQLKIKKKFEIGDLKTPDSAPTKGAEKMITEGFYLNLD